MTRRHSYPQSAKFPLWFRVVVIGLLIVILWALVFGIATWAARASATEACPLFGAHRGSEWPAPYTEDSRGAMAAAAADPAVYYRENDVWPTSDGIGVMNHDKDWDRTMSKGAYLIANHTYAWTMKNIRLKDGSRPLSVQEYIDSIGATHKPSYIHIKSDAVVPDVARRLRAARVQKWTRVIAQSAATLRHFHRLAPGYHREYVVPGSRSPQTGVAREFAGRVMLWQDNPYPSSHVQSYLDAGLDVEIVVNNTAMARFASQFPAVRVLAADVGDTRNAWGCAA